MPLIIVAVAIFVPYFAKFMINTEGDEKLRKYLKTLV
jgi:hypothetical protein